MNTTKEEDRMILAAIAMHGLITSTAFADLDVIAKDGVDARRIVALVAVEQADALIAELEKSNEQRV